MRIQRVFRQENERADALGAQDVLARFLEHAPERPVHSFYSGNQDDLFSPERLPPPEKTVNWYFNGEVPFHQGPMSFALVVSSGSHVDENGEPFGRKKILLNLNTPDLKLAYRLFPSGQAAPARLRLRDLPPKERTALVRVLDRFILDNPGFNRLPPSDGGLSSAARAKMDARLGPIVEAEGKNVKHWLKDAIGRP